MAERTPWMLPEGFEELLPPEAARMEALRRALVDLFQSWGYDLVVPPFIEYLESLLTGTGHDLDLQTFKITDQVTGRTMGIRADMTPQVARIDAHHLEWEGPVRLCYLGEVLHTRPDGFGGSRSLLQVGAELYGHGGVESDVEVLCLLLETLAAAGLARIHLDLGHVAIFRGLARQAGLDAASEQALFDALQRKARPEIDAFLDRLEVDPEAHRMLAGLVDLNGGPEVLEEARGTLAGASEAVRAALAELESVFRQVHARVPEVPLYFDLAELRGYGFHTGVVFAAFVPGHGEEIARGGRYDAIGRFFGRARPATGFSTDLKTLVKLREEAAPAAEEAGGVLAPWSDDPALLARVRELRAAGTRVCWLLPGQEPPAGAWDRRLVARDGTWVIEAAGS